MTATLISLISILIGILGANITGCYFKKYSFGLTGNTISGVFGSIFFIKSFGRLGFNSEFIVVFEQINYTLFAINSIISFLGGALPIFIIYQIKKKIT